MEETHKLCTVPISLNCEDGEDLQRLVRHPFILPEEK